ncbi:hypothetical protein Taro_007189, partial [Colocasia esculenta]|nr:hypothetical protein [Colocasia esculenta]
MMGSKKPKRWQKTYSAILTMDGRVGRLGAESADSESGRPLATRLWGGNTDPPTGQSGLASIMPFKKNYLARDNHSQKTRDGVVPKGIMMPALARPRITEANLPSLDSGYHVVATLNPEGLAPNGSFIPPNMLENDPCILAERRYLEFAILRFRDSLLGTCAFSYPSFPLEHMPLKRMPTANNLSPYNRDLDCYTRSRKLSPVIWNLQNRHTTTMEINGTYLMPGDSRYAAGSHDIRCLLDRIIDFTSPSWYGHWSVVSSHIFRYGATEWLTGVLHHYGEILKKSGIYGAVEAALYDYPCYTGVLRGLPISGLLYEEIVLDDLHSHRSNGSGQYFYPYSLPGDPLTELMSTRSSLSFLPNNEQGLLQFDNASRRTRPFCTQTSDGTQYHSASSNSSNQSVYQDWLCCIRPGVLVYRVGSTLITEPYYPSRFARNFGYDQSIPPPAEFPLSLRLQRGHDVHMTAASWWNYFRRPETGSACALPAPGMTGHMDIFYARWWFDRSGIFRLSPGKIREREDSRLVQYSLSPVFIDEAYLNRHFSSIAASYKRRYDASMSHNTKAETDRYYYQGEIPLLASVELFWTKAPVASDDSSSYCWWNHLLSDCGHPPAVSLSTKLPPESIGHPGWTRWERHLINVIGNIGPLEYISRLKNAKTFQDVQDIMKRVGEACSTTFFQLVPKPLSESA